MSTNDPAGRVSDRRTRRTALADDRGSAAMFALPDPSVIARLANEFFAALPSNAAVRKMWARAPPLVPPPARFQQFRRRRGASGRDGAWRHDPKRSRIPRRSRFDWLTF